MLRKDLKMWEGLKTTHATETMAVEWTSVILRFF